MMRRIAWPLAVTIGLGGGAWLTTFTAPIPASESTACGVSPERAEGERWFYPPGQREACLRVLKALAELKAQRTRGELAATTAPNDGWLGERKHADEQALEAAQRVASET